MYKAPPGVPGRRDRFGPRTIHKSQKVHGAPSTKMKKKTPRIHPSPATNTKFIILPTFHTTNECVYTLLVCVQPPSALASAAKPSQVSAKPLAAAAQPSATRVSFTVPAWAAWSGLAPAT